MKRAQFTFEIITPCFLGGANPNERAEIRVPSIRGQLRWWFRLLGGFKSMTPMSIGEQESLIFGSAAGDSGNASRLLIRIAENNLISTKKDAQNLGYAPFSNSGYLAFPIQSRTKNGQTISDASKGVFTSGTFTLTGLLRSSQIPIQDIQALFTIFGHLGSLGFRSRRAMGALAFSSSPPMSLANAFSHFNNRDNILIKSIPANSASNAISRLGGWLKSCRAHGRSGENEEEQKSPYFKFAKNDHDIGYNRPGTERKPAYRPALGLPIVQKITGGTNNWEYNQTNHNDTERGRFASPVLLRPHKGEDGEWHGLVIFVESKRWPDGKSVYLNGQERQVSTELYEKMKEDSALTSFHPQ